MNYIQPLSTFKFNLKAKKLQGLTRLAKLSLPTVSNLFIVSPELYLEFLDSKELSSRASQEIESIFKSIILKGDTVTLRNSIYEESNPGISFSVHNSLNIRSFIQLKKKIVQGYKKAVKVAIDPSQVEFSFLIQSFRFS